MPLLTRYAKSYRLTRAVAAALVLVFAIVSMWWAKSHPPVSVDRVTGTITETLESGLASGETRLVRVRLQDGREARVLVPTFAVRPASAIPLIVESYEDGPASVIFDRERWIDDVAR